jgi:3-dehydroquinate synthase
MKNRLWPFLKIGLLVFGVSVLVSVPFMIFGEALFMPAFEALRHSTFWLVMLAIALLSADAVLPVPSAWVIIFLAQEKGLAAGIVGGSVGLAVGVLVSGWVGRAAVGRAAPKFFPAAEMERLRVTIERHTIVTLACMRSVPVLAETSVMIAAGAGVPIRRIFWMTLAPNIAIAVIYSVAASDSFLTACLAFLATVAVSYLAWRGYERFAGVKADS